MTNRSNEDIANALRQLGGGEPHRDDADKSDPPSLPQRAGPTSADQTSGGRPAVAPAGEGTAMPRPSHQPALVVPTRLARPSAPGESPAAPRPAVPTGLGAAPTLPRPMMPTAGPVEFVQGDARPAGGALDDDVATMPAPSVDYLAHRAPAAPRQRPTGRSPGVRATTIPVLLTIGALLIAAAALKYAVHPDATLALMPTWLAAILAGAGMVMIGLAVTHALQARAAAATGVRS